MIEALQYITNATNIKGQIQEITEACEAGIKWIQLRMKNVNEETVLETAKAAKAICDKYNVKLIINDHVHIAKSVHASGVHIGKDDMSIAKTVEVLGNEFIIGCTANTLDDINHINQHPVSYIGLGPLRFTTTKQRLSPVLGIEEYESILSKTHSSIPIIAVGGIQEDDILKLLNTGVSGIAASNLITSSPNKKELVERLQLSLTSNEIKHITYE